MVFDTGLMFAGVAARRKSRTPGRKPFVMGAQREGLFLLVDASDPLVCCEVSFRRSRIMIKAPDSRSSWL